VLAKRPHGKVGKANFEYREGRIPKPGDGKVLVKICICRSIRPSVAGWRTAEPSPPVKIGEVMRASSVGEVVVSNHPDFAPGDKVMTGGGWQDYCVVSPTGAPFGVNKLPAGVPLTMPLSVLGVTGLTAYWGMLDLGQPKAGDTVLVSGAAGATGSVAGQIARIKGCRVVGIAGGADKCKWLKKEARFDAVIDYAKEDVDARIGVVPERRRHLFRQRRR
jgi:NADPH-dependent curcumin reductase CurA